MDNRQLLDNIKTYLEDNQIAYGNTFVLNQADTENTFSDYIRALIYSLLSARTSWNKVEAKLAEVDDLFFQYDKDKILEQDQEYFYQGILQLRIASQVTHKQMKVLHKNIRTFETIENDYDSLDNFVKTRKPIYIAHMLSTDLQYKLDQVGLPLACELLRNVGVDLIKPDVHICRILGKDRLGYSENPTATEIEAYETAEILRADTDYPLTVIDSLLWNYCSRGYGEVCGATPKCYKCVIKERCNK
ncbi:hypothetical protein [[Clostridium] fimetarium]|uniref:Endonuclease III n=1 Tax=[Clostridium] fimetarium TaxID=99656 RepID=A0A1I0QUY7_9FIRM|nr:hypothetical protein [[Clostridium] fimetarium]SEW31468.1 Endonuclease III [[Clostridium] fimetarium]